MREIGDVAIFLAELRRRIRSERITQRDLAAAALLSYFQVNRILRGHVPAPKKRTLERLRAAYEVLSGRKW